MVLSNWLRGIASRPSLQRRSRQRRKLNWAARSESLEDKVLLSNDGILQVNSGLDVTDPHDGHLTLREALVQAGIDPGIHTIRLGLGHHSTIELENPLIIEGIEQGVDIEPVQEGVSISVTVGPWDPTLDQDPNQHVVRVMPGSDVTLKNIALVGGDTPSADGGTIWNAGNLTLNRVTVSDGITAGSGGGVYNSPTGSLTVTSSTFSGNTATTGGAIHNDGTVTLTDSTVAENSSGLSSGMGQIVVSNSIVAQNIGYDVSGNVQSAGYNLIGNADGLAFSQAGDQSGTSTAPLDPLLGDFQGNGGAGWTYQLLPGSPAIDAGSSSAEFDQRGAPRSIDGPDPGDRTDTVSTPDIGAFEFGAFFVNTSLDAIDSTSVADGMVDADSAEPGHQVSLRAAVLELNSLAGYGEDPELEPDQLEGHILFRNRMMAQLSIDGTGENHASVGDLDVFGNLTVSGQTEIQSTPGTDEDHLVPTTGVMGAPNGVDSGATDDRRFSDRIFHVLPGANFQVDSMQVSAGYTLDDGTEDGGHGGAILNDGGDVTLVKAALGNLHSLVLVNTGNYAQRKGGAVYSRDGKLTISNSFVGLSRSRMGAGVYIESGEATVNNDSEFWDNGAGVRGGAFYLQEGLLNVTDTWMNENASNALLDDIEAGFNGNRGGAIYNEMGAVRLGPGTSITASSGGEMGGAIFNGNTLELDGVYFGDGNFAEYGGGIYNDGTLIIRDSTIDDSTARRGGAIFNRHAATTEIHNSEFVSNGALERGGAILNLNGVVDIYGSLFRESYIASSIDETDWQLGGAIYSSDYDAVLSIQDSTFDGNTALTYGGAIYSRFGDTHIEGSTFFENAAFGAGEFATSGSGGAILHTNEPAGLEEITANMPTGATEIPVASSAKFERYALPFKILVSQIDSEDEYGSRVHEEMTVVGFSHNKLQVVRDLPVESQIGEILLENEPGFVIFGGSLSVNNSTFTDNSASGGTFSSGGAISVGVVSSGDDVAWGPSSTITNSTFFRNRAEYVGAIMAAGSGTLQAADGETLTIPPSVYLENNVVAGSRLPHPQVVGLHDSHPLVTNPVLDVAGGHSVGGNVVGATWWGDGYADYELFELTQTLEETDTVLHATRIPTIPENGKIALRQEVGTQIFSEKVRVLDIDPENLTITVERGVDRTEPRRHDIDLEDVHGLAPSTFTQMGDAVGFIHEPLDAGLGPLVGSPARHGLLPGSLALDRDSNANGMGYAETLLTNLDADYAQREFSVADASLFRYQKIRIGGEVMLVESANLETNTVRVSRGAYGTWPEAHATGALIEFGFNGQSTALNGPVADSTTTEIEVQPIAYLPAWDFMIEVGTESMLVTGVAENLDSAGGIESMTFTVVRGYNNSAATQHSAGRIVELYTDQRDASSLVSTTSTAKLRDAGSVEAQIFTVNTTADKIDEAPGDGVVNTDVIHEVSLRAAIMEANALYGDATIVLPGGEFTLSLAGDDDSAASGDLDITRDLVIRGQSADTTFIDANGLGRVFDIFPGASLTVSNLTIRNGSVDGDGGLVRVDGGGLTLIRTSLEGGSASHGGAIHATDSEIEIISSVLHGNTAFVETSQSGAGSNTGGPGGNNPGGVGPGGTGGSTEPVELIGDGGAIAAFGSTISIQASTFSGNNASNRGGGIYAVDASTVNLRGTTVTENSADSAGGVWSSGAGSAVNSMIAANIDTTQPLADGTMPEYATLPDAWGSFTSLGHNLIGVSQPSATLGEVLVGEAMELTLEEDIPLPDAPFTIRIVDEVITVTAVDGLLLSLERDVSNVEYPAGTPIRIDGFWEPGDVRGTEATPLDPLLGPLQNNGGAILSHEPLQSSPLIGSGSIQHAGILASQLAVGAGPPGFGSAGFRELHVTDTTALPNVPFDIRIDDEQLTVVNVSGRALTVETPITSHHDRWAEVYVLSDSRGERSLADTTPSIGATTRIAAVGITADQSVNTESDFGSVPYTFTIVRTGSDSMSPLTVDYSVVGVGFNPAEPEDFGGTAYPSGQVTLFGNQTTLTIYVSGDSLIEGHETFAVQLHIDDFNNGPALVNDSALATIWNNDLASVSISAGTMTDEGNDGEGPQFTYDVTLVGQFEDNVWVDVSTVDDTAIAGQDYVPNSQRWHSSMPQQFTVTGLTDMTVELNEWFLVHANLEHFDKSALVGAFAQDSGVLMNDDSTSLTVSDASVVEGDEGTTYLEFTLELGQPVDVPVSVDVATQDLSAVAGIDYDAINETVVIDSGQLSKTVRIPITTNLDLESDRTFALLLSNIDATNRDVTLGTNVATGTIIDDDEPRLAVGEVNRYETHEGREWFLFEVTLSKPVSDSFTVDITTADWTATAGSDYLENSSTLEFDGYNGEQQYFTVLVEGDDAFEPNESFEVKLSNVQGPNSDSFTLVDSFGQIINDDIAPPTDDDDDGGTDDDDGGTDDDGGGTDGGGGDGGTDGGGDGGTDGGGGGGGTDGGGGGGGTDGGGGGGGTDGGGGDGGTDGGGGGGGTDGGGGGGGTDGGGGDGGTDGGGDGFTNGNGGSENSGGYNGASNGAGLGGTSNGGGTDCETVPGDQDGTCDGDPPADPPPEEDREPNCGLAPGDEDEHPNSGNCEGRPPLPPVVVQPEDPDDEDQPPPATEDQLEEDPDLRSRYTCKALETLDHNLTSEFTSHDYEVSHRSQLTFNPISTYTVPAGVNFAVEPSLRYWIDGQELGGASLGSIQGEYITFEANSDLTLTFTPQDGLASQQGRLRPETNSAGHIVRYSGLETETIELRHTVWAPGTLPGTVSGGTIPDGALTGVGTTFTKDLKVGDTLRFQNGQTFKIQSIESDVELTLDAPVEAEFLGLTYTRATAVTPIAAVNFELLVTNTLPVFRGELIHNGSCYEMENNLKVFRDTEYVTDLNDYFFDPDGDQISIERIYSDKPFEPYWEHAGDTNDDGEIDTDDDGPKKFYSSDAYPYRHEVSTGGTGDADTRYLYARARGASQVSLYSDLRKLDTVQDEATVPQIWARATDGQALFTPLGENQPKTKTFDFLINPVALNRAAPSLQEAVDFDGYSEDVVSNSVIHKDQHGFVDGQQIIYHSGGSSHLFSVDHDFADGQLFYATNVSSDSFMLATTEDQYSISVTAGSSTGTESGNHSFTPAKPGVQEDLSAAVTTHPIYSRRSVPVELDPLKPTVLDSKTRDEHTVVEQTSPHWLHDALDLHGSGPETKDLKLENWTIDVEAVGGTYQQVAGTSVDLQTGQFQLQHGLILDASGGTAAGSLPGLVYDSATVTPRPTIQATLKASSPAHLQVSTIFATLRWFDPTSGEPTTTFTAVDFAVTPSVLEQGEFTIAVQPSEAPEVTGVYGWELEILLAGNGQEFRFEERGATTVVVQQSVDAAKTQDGKTRQPHRPEFGSGWSLSGLPELFVDSHANDHHGDDRIILAFPGEQPTVFRPDGGGYGGSDTYKGLDFVAVDVTSRMAAYGGRFQGVTNSDERDAAWGLNILNDASEFGTLTSDWREISGETSSRDVLIYDDGFGTEYIFARYEQTLTSDDPSQDGAEVVRYLLREIKHDNAPSVQIKRFETQSEDSQYDLLGQIDRIVNVDGSEVEFQYFTEADANHTLVKKLVVKHENEALFEHHFVYSGNNLEWIKHHEAGATYSTNNDSTPFPVLARQLGNDANLADDILYGATGEVERSTLYTFETTTSGERILKQIAPGAGIGITDTNAPSPYRISITNQSSLLADHKAGTESVAWVSQNSNLANLAGTTQPTTSLERYEYGFSSSNATGLLNNTLGSYGIDLIQVDTAYVTLPSTGTPDPKALETAFKTATTLSTVAWSYDHLGAITATTQLASDQQNGFGEYRSTTFRYDYEVPENYKENQRFAISFSAEGDPDLEPPEFIEGSYRGNVRYLTDVGGRTRFVYDVGVGDGDLVRVRTSQGVVSDYSVTEPRHIAAIGGRTDYLVENGFVTRVTNVRENATDRIESNVYHTDPTEELFGLLKQSIDARGLLTEYHYDDQERLSAIKVTDPAETGNAKVTSTGYEYDSFGHVDVVTTYYGPWTESPSESTEISTNYFQNDVLGRVTESQFLSSHALSESYYEYAADGQVVRAGNADDVYSDFFYNLAGQLTHETVATGETYNSKYSGPNNEESVEQLTAYSSYSNGQLKQILHERVEVLTESAAISSWGFEIEIPDHGLSDGAYLQIEKVSGAILDFALTDGMTVRVQRLDNNRISLSDESGTPIYLWGTGSDALEGGQFRLAGHDHATEFYYDPSNRTSWTRTTNVAQAGFSLGNHDTRTKVDWAGRVVEQHDLLTGATTQYAYQDPRSNAPTSVRDVGFRTAIDSAQDRVSRTTYDASGRPILVLSPEASAPGALYQYDELGYLVSQSTFVTGQRSLAETGMPGHLTTYVTSSAGDVIGVTEHRANPLDVLGDGMARVEELRFRNTYDGRGRLVLAEDPLTSADLSNTGVTEYNAKAASYSYEYDGDGLLKITSTARDGALTKQWLDAFGRSVKSQSALGAIETRVFDAVGNLTNVFLDFGSSEIPDRHTYYEHDALGRSRSVTLVGSSNPDQTSYTDYLRHDQRLTDGTHWDRIGTGPYGATVRQRFDSDGAIRATQLPSPSFGDIVDGVETVYSYTFDSSQQTVVTESLTDNSAVIVHTGGPSQGAESRGKTVTSVDGRLFQQYATQVGSFGAWRLSRTQEYDLAGRVNKDIDESNGLTTHAEYSVVTGQTTTVYLGPHAAGTPQTVYLYDSAGNLIRTRNRGNTSPDGGTSYHVTTNTYDELGRRTAERLTAVEPSLPAASTAESTGDVLTRTWAYFAAVQEYSNRNGERTTTSVSYPADRTGGSPEDFVSDSFVSTEAWAGKALPYAQLSKGNWEIVPRGEMATIESSYYASGQLHYVNTSAPGEVGEADDTSSTHFAYDEFGRESEELQSGYQLGQSLPVFQVDTTHSLVGGLVPTIHANLRVDGAELSSVHSVLDATGNVIEFSQTHSPDREVAWPTGLVGQSKSVSISRNPDGSVAKFERFDIATDGVKTSRGISEFFYVPSISQSANNNVGEPGDIWNIFHTLDGSSVAKYTQTYERAPDGDARKLSGYAAEFWHNGQSVVSENLDIELDQYGQVTDLGEESRSFDAAQNRIDDRVVAAPNRLIRDGRYVYTYDNEGRVVSRTFNSIINESTATSETAERSLELTRFESTKVQGREGSPAEQVKGSGSSILSPALSAKIDAYWRGLAHGRYSLWITYKEDADYGEATFLTYGAESTLSGTIDFSSDSGFGSAHADGVSWKHLGILDLSEGDHISFFMYGHNSEYIPFDAIKLVSNTDKYTWDQRNRLTEVQTTDIDSTSVSTNKFRYDGLDRLIAEESNDETVHHVYSGSQRLFTFDESHRVARGYFQTPVGLLATDETRTTPGGTAWMFADTVGTVRSVLETRTGQIQHRHFTVNGSPLSVAGDASAWLDNVPQVFRGMQYTASTGLYQSDGIFYDPYSGRSFVDRGGENGYVAFNNNPLELAGSDTYEEQGSLGLFWGLYKQDVGTRLIGVAQVWGGLAQIGAGCATGIGCIPAVGVGGDEVFAGFGTILTGEHTNTLRYRLAERVTGSKTAATVIDLGIGIGSAGLDDVGRAFIKFGGRGTTGAAARAARHGLRHAAVESGITLGAGTAGYAYSGGDWDTAVNWAIVGNMAGGIAASAFVKCFVAGTPVAVATTVDAAVLPNFDEEAGHGAWIASGLALVAASQLLKDERRQTRGLVSKPSVLEPVMAGPDPEPEPEVDFSDLDFGSICDELQFS